jgi:hypothetical protein
MLLGICSDALLRKDKPRKPSAYNFGVRVELIRHVHFVLPYLSHINTQEHRPGFSQHQCVPFDSATCNLVTQTGGRGKDFSESLMDLFMHSGE